MRPAPSTDEPPFADLAAAQAVALPRPDSSFPLLSDEERAEFASLADAFAPPESPSILTGSPAAITADFLVTDPVALPPIPSLPNPPTAPVSVAPTPVIPELSTAPAPEPAAPPPASPPPPAPNPNLAALLRAAALAEPDPATPQPLPNPSPETQPATPAAALPPVSPPSHAKPVLPAPRSVDPNADVEHPALLLGNLAARLAPPVHTIPPSQSPPSPPQSDAPPASESFSPTAFFDPGPEEDADDNWTSLSALLKSDAPPEPDAPAAIATPAATDLPSEPKPFLPPIVTRAAAAAAASVTLEPSPPEPEPAAAPPASVPLAQSHVSPPEPSSASNLDHDDESSTSIGLLIGGALLIIAGLYLATISAGATISITKSTPARSIDIFTMFTAGAASALLLLIGTGAVAYRRWAPPLIHALGWILVLFTLTWAGTAAAAAFYLMGDPGNALSLPKDSARFLIIAAVSGIAIPLAFIGIAQRDSATRACDAAQPFHSWTDTKPVPVLMTFLTGIAVTTITLALGFAGFNFPAFGAFTSHSISLPAWAGTGVVFLFASILAAAQRKAGWWLLLLASLALATALFMSFQQSSAAGFTEAAEPRTGGSLNAALIAAGTILPVIFILLMSRKSFDLRPDDHEHDHGDA